MVLLLLLSLLLMTRMQKTVIGEYSQRVALLIMRLQLVAWWKLANKKNYTFLIS